MSNYSQAGSSSNALARTKGRKRRAAVVCLASLHKKIISIFTRNSETGVSLRNLDACLPLPWNSSKHHKQMIPRATRWALNQAPVMPRDGSLSPGSWWRFSQPGLGLRAKSESFAFRGSAKFCNRNDNFKQVIWILVNWYISTLSCHYSDENN